MVSGWEKTNIDEILKDLETVVIKICLYNPKKNILNLNTGRNMEY